LQQRRYLFCLLYPYLAHVIALLAGLGQFVGKIIQAEKRRHLQFLHNSHLFASFARGNNSIFLTLLHKKENATSSESWNSATATQVNARSSCA